MQEAFNRSDALKSGSRKLSRASSEDTRVSSSSFDARIEDNTQLLRLETITDSESRRILTFMKVTVMVAILLAMVMTAIKESPRGAELVVLNRNYVIAQVVTFGVLLSAVLLMFTMWVARIARSWYDGMAWSTRRSRSVQAAGVRGLVTLVVVGGQFASNLKLLTDPSVFCYSKVFIPTTGFLVWMGLNTTLLLLVVDAHSTNLAPNKHRSDGTVRDRPWTSHWPKIVFLWGPFSGVIIWVITMYAQDGHATQVKVLNGGDCTWGAEVQCNISTALYTASALTITAVLVYFCMYAYFLWRAWRQLSTKLYQRYRMVNMLVRIQTRVNGVMVGALLMGILLTWFLGGNTCVNYAITWFGAAPVTLSIVAMQFISFFLTFPRSKRALAAYNAVPAYLLQQFAWTEADVQRKRDSRNSSVATTTGISLEQAPLFCFETAIKLFFWSVLMYSYKEADPENIMNVPAAIRELIGEMDAAMRMFNLKKRHLFYDRTRGTKVLVTWNATTILIAVRGSAEMANLIEDAKFLQTAHPPARKFNGRQPRVHRGFLATWTANNIHKRVLAHVGALLDSAQDRSAVRVLCTGHSLGGAVAQLASFDIVRELGVSPQQVSTYTYGCPRLGNHALAADFAEVVPDTWHIINNNDLVTRTMKLLGMYKRAGNRIIVNQRGDLIVRPNHLETSLLQQVWGGTGRHHITVEYKNSLIAIVTAQLQISSRHSDGLQGLLGLLKDVPQIRVAMEAHAAQLGTTLVDLVRTAGTLGTMGRTASLAAPVSQSQRFSGVQHASLVRAGGGSDVEAAPAAAVVAYGSDTRSPSSAESVEEMPAAFLEGQVDGSDSPGVQKLDAAQGALLQDATVEAATGITSRWRTAAAIARMALGMRRSGGEQAPEEVAPAPDAHAAVSQKRCYIIPENDASAVADSAVTLEHSDAEEGGRHAQKNGSADKAQKWRSPLSCRPEDLPEDARLEGPVLHMGAAPDMRSCSGSWMASTPLQGRRGGQVATGARGEVMRDARSGARLRPQPSAEPHESMGSRTLELVDAMAEVDIEVAAEDSQADAEEDREGAGGAVCAPAAARRALAGDSGSTCSSADAVQKTSALALQETKELANTNSWGDSTLSAQGGGLSLSPVTPAGQAVMFDAGGQAAHGQGRRGGSAAVAERRGGGALSTADSYADVFLRSIDNQLFLSDTVPETFVHAMPSPSPSPPLPLARASPPSKPQGIGRCRGEAASAWMDLVDTDAVVLQIDGGGGSDHKFAVGTGELRSVGSGAGSGTSRSCHQEVSLMDVDPLHQAVGRLPPRPPSGAAAIGGMSPAEAYLAAGAQGKVGGIPWPLSIGRASDDDSMHLTTGSVWSCGGVTGGAADSVDGSEDSTQHLGGIGRNGLPILGWNQIPHQEPERVRGAGLNFSSARRQAN